MSSDRELLFAEDLVVGSSFDVGSWEVSLEDIIEFARRWDPLPMHVDIEAATATPIGEIIASGMHTMAIMQRLNADGFYSKVAIIAGRSLSNLRLVKPVRPGTRLHGRQTIDAVTRRPSGRALVTTTSTLVDQTGALVLSMTGQAVVLQGSTNAEGPPNASPDSADRGQALPSPSASSRAV